MANFGPAEDFTISSSQKTKKGSRSHPLFHAEPKHDSDTSITSLPLAK
jgi:hypothetical protein